MQTEPLSLETNVANVAGRESTLGASQIEEWLNAQKQEQTPIKNDVIDRLIASLDYESKFVDVLTEGEYGKNLVVIPLDENFESQNNNALDPLNALLLFEDSIGNIKKGNIVQFIPNDVSVTSFPEGELQSLYNHKKVPKDGRMVFLSLSDVFWYEFEFSEGNVSHERSVSFGDDLSNCSSWWLITTTYTYEFGELLFVNQNSEYLGTTCTSCPPNQWCDEMEGSGGGGFASLDEPTLTAVRKTLIIRRVMPTSELNANWHAFAEFNLIGYIFDNSSFNYFVSATPFGFIHFANIGAHDWNQHSLHATWISGTHTSDVDNIDKFAHGQANGTVSYPNAPSQPSQNVGNHIQWNASVDLN